MNNNLTFNNITNHLPLTVQSYVERMKDTPQGYDWHPEGDCFIHSNIVFLRALKTLNVNVVLAAFFHDLGKVDTTMPNGKGGYSAHDHEKVSCDLIKYSRQTIELFGGDYNIIFWIVKNHMKVKYLDEMSPKKQKDLINHIWWKQLNLFRPCDQMGSLTTLEVIRSGGNPLKYLFNKIKFTLLKNIKKYNKI